MLINISNIGIVQDAKINMGGFTVIAGENDSGKSTIGKVIYSLTQACTNYPQYRREVISSNIRHRLRSITLEIRRNFDLTRHEFLKPLASYSFVNNIIRDVDGSLYSVRAMLDELDRYYPEKRSVVDHIKSQLNLIQRDVDMSLNSDMVFGYISNVMESEFGGEVCGKLGNFGSEVEIVDGESTVLSVRISEGNQVSGEYIGDIGYSDATFIDGVSVLQLSSSLGFFVSESTLPFHVVDLYKKLTTPSFGRGSMSDVMNLNGIYKGRLIFDQERSGFFLDKGGKKVCLSNIASGIKNLGIIDMLTRNGVVCEGSLLVLDEPETNLHPRWQVELARIICELRRAGVHLLVTTHSPYMIQALAHYADEYFIDSNFYLACKNTAIEDRVDFLDMTGNVSEIIDALAAPLWEILES